MGGGILLRGIPVVEFANPLSLQVQFINPLGRFVSMTKPPGFCTLYVRLYGCVIIRGDGKPMILSYGDKNQNFGPKSARSIVRGVVTICASAFIAAMVSPAAHAQPASCDPAYWESMNQRGMLEAQREIQNNQNLIFKADSVLELTCFDRQLQSLAARAINMFSETTRWGVILSPVSMDNALNGLVSGGLSNYIANNSFAHPYGGGRFTGDYTMAPASAATPTYNCNTMAIVWEAAKCYNFAEEGKDGFFTLASFAEPRTGIGHQGFACSGDGRLGNMRSVAFNAADQYQTEPYNSYSALFSTTACSNPIPTGVRVERNGIAPYNEHVCINPGCAYNRSSGCVTNPP